MKYQDSLLHSVDLGPQRQTATCGNAAVGRGDRLSFSDMSVAGVRVSFLRPRFFVCHFLEDVTNATVDALCCSGRHELEAAAKRQRLSEEWSPTAKCVDTAVAGPLRRNHARSLRARSEHLRRNCWVSTSTNAKLLQFKTSISSPACLPEHTAELEACCVKNSHDRDRTGNRTIDTVSQS